MKDRRAREASRLLFAMICGIELLFVHPFGSDCSTSVTWVVLGERASIDHPWRSIWVRMMMGSTGGIEGNRPWSSVENENTCTDVGLLYVVLSCTLSLALDQTTSRGFGQLLPFQSDEQDLDLRDRPRSACFPPPDLAELVDIIQQDSVLVCLVPGQTSARTADDREQIPDADADKDRLRPINDERPVDRVQLMDRNPSAGFKDGFPLRLRLLKQRSKV